MITSMLILSSCANRNLNKLSDVSEVIDNHPEAHSILFYDPNTAFINEGDKSLAPRKLDYIAFSYGFITVKFIGEEEVRYYVDEPSFASRASVSYWPKDSNYSFSVRLDNCVVFEVKDGELVASHITLSSEDRMMEYMNILVNMGKSKTPPTVKLLMELTNHASEAYYPLK